jgi:hypothetical protein
MVNWSFSYPTLIRHAPSGPRLHHQQRQQATDTLLLISVLLGVLNSGGGPFSFRRVRQYRGALAAEEPKTVDLHRFGVSCNKMQVLPP